jgi:hypothetical protein
MKYDYPIHPDNSPDIFRSTCVLIDNNIKYTKKEELLVDVDGSTYQEYYVDKNKIVVFDDYDVGAVYVESDIDLSHLFSQNYTPKQVHQSE